MEQSSRLSAFYMLDFLIFHHKSGIGWGSLLQFHLTFTLLAATWMCADMITFANSVHPEQDQPNVGPGLDPNCLTIW